MIQPQANIQLSTANSDRFLKAACKVIARGFGYPSIFNAEKIIEQQLVCGKSLFDARSGGINGCVETVCHGKEAAIDTGYLNCPKILELTIRNGFDIKTNKEIGLKTGLVKDFDNFEQFLNALEKQAKYFIDLKVSRNQYIEQMYANYMPVPFVSTLIKDCISKGKDYNDGGPRYNNTYLQCVGIGTISDSLSAIKHFIYDSKEITWEELLEALENDFVENEKLRMKLMNQPHRYGNDDKKADLLMQFISNMFMSLIDGRQNTKGGKYYTVMLPTTSHIYFGSVTGATADGRHAWAPLSEGISAVQGANINGPTATLKSAAMMDHGRTCGALLNMKFSTDLVSDEDGFNKMTNLIRGYFKIGGSHLQFNIVDKQTLLKAQMNPENYRDLIVRVAGYSDYFYVLGKDLQDEIINRTQLN